MTICVPENEPESPPAGILEPTFKYVTRCPEVTRTYSSGPKPSFIHALKVGDNLSFIRRSQRAQEVDHWW
ncbi:hypothetical protein GYMLUDRAFT_36477 [Collybiopsis luxurians FD-317 M1]|nr:hypothetical protein GYMLUDRAFT_36477 [Collybiopsis luxurians FD-317 M1]